MIYVIITDNNISNNCLIYYNNLKAGSVVFVISSQGIGFYGDFIIQVSVLTLQSSERCNCNKNNPLYI